MGRVRIAWALVCAVGCQGPEVFNRVAEMAPPGAGGSSAGASGTAGTAGGIAGVFGTGTGTAGSVAGTAGGVAGTAGGATGAAGGSSGGAAGTVGNAGATGNPAGMSGAAGSSGGGGGAGMKGGAGGTAGSVGGSAGAAPAGGGSGGTAPAAGGTGGASAAAGGPGTDAGASDAVVTGSCPGVYCDNFESDAVGPLPARWVRVGGSDGDWNIIAGTSHALAQNHAQSSTLRMCYPASAAGAPWSGAITLAAQVKILLAGSSGTTDTLVCPRYALAGDFQCLVLQPGIGARVRTRQGGATTDGPIWPVTVAVGGSYQVRVSLDATGKLTAAVDGNLLAGTDAGAPAAAPPSGTIAVGTQSAEAAFDEIVVTRP